MLRLGVVYEIKNITNNKRYVGSSISYGHRKNDRLSRLRGGKHHSIILQRAFDKYGEASFVFTIIEDGISIELLREREQYWLDELEPEYNISKVAELCPMSGRHHSDATKAKISNSKSGLPKVKQAPAHTRKIAEAKYKPIAQIDISTGSVVRCFSSGKGAEEYTGICHKNISRVVTGKYKTAGGYGWKFI